MKILIKFLILISAIIALSGCGGGSSSPTSKKSCYRITKLKSYSFDGSTATETFKYSNSKLIRVYYYFSTINGYADYSYNSDGKLIGENAYENGSLKYKYIFQYDANGKLKLIKEVDINNPNIVKSKKIYFYTNNKLVKIEKDFDNNGIVDKRIFFTYSDNKIIKITTSFNTYYYKYDSSGKRIELQEDENNDGAIDIKGKYIYENGVLSKISFYKTTNPSKKAIISYNWEKDPNCQSINILNILFDYIY